MEACRGGIREFDGRRVALALHTLRLRCQNKQVQPGLALDDLKARVFQQFLNLLRRESRFVGAETLLGDLKTAAGGERNGRRKVNRL